MGLGMPLNASLRKPKKTITSYLPWPCPSHWHWWIISSPRVPGNISAFGKLPWDFRPALKWISTGLMVPIPGKLQNYFYILDILHEVQDDSPFPCSINLERRARDEEAISCKWLHCKTSLEKNLWAVKETTQSMEGVKQRCGVNWGLVLAFSHGGSLACMVPPSCPTLKQGC